ncbi:MAG: hypothetical protein ACRCU9_03130 [Iodobacter sp.]
MAIILLRILISFLPQLDSERIAHKNRAIDKQALLTKVIIFIFPDKTGGPADRFLSPQGALFIHPRQYQYLID